MFYEVPQTAKTECKTCQLIKKKCIYKGWNVQTFLGAFGGVAILLIITVNIFIFK